MKNSDLHYIDGYDDGIFGMDENQLNMANNEELKANIKKMRKEIHDYKGTSNHLRSPSYGSASSQSPKATMNHQTNSPGAQLYYNTYSNNRFGASLPHSKMHQDKSPPKISAPTHAMMQSPYP